jgi:hypothetical protein
MVTGSFMAEFNNAIFRGNVSTLYGTFSGTLTAQAINAVKNLNIAGRAAAITYVTTRGQAVGFDDDGQWRTVHSLGFNVPGEDSNGGWVSAAIQYHLVDHKGDNDLFHTVYRVLLDGNPIYSSPRSDQFGGFCKTIVDFFHEVSAPVGGPGYHSIELQFAWLPGKTNVYPEFTDITIRADYVRK